MNGEMNNSRPTMPMGQPAHQPVHHNPVSAVREKTKKISENSRLIRAMYVTMLVLVSLVLCGAVILSALGEDKATKFIDKDRYQAVFLSGEDPQSTTQSYFGKLTSVDENTYKMTDIYYLTVNQAVQPGTSQQQQQQKIQLTRLGCEIHGPDSVMYINKAKVMYWENLKDDGRVVKAITDYLKQNPGEQKCETSQQTNDSSSNSNNTNSTNSTNKTTNSTTNSTNSTNSTNNTTTP